MDEIIVLLSSIILAVLFLFLLFNFVIALLAIMLRERKYAEYQPSVSIVIPTFNEEKNIALCLDSIAALEYPKDKIEVIIVDDGSSDNTVKIAEEYGIKAIKQKHLGKVEALNNGIKNSRHEFVLTLDADTSIEKNCLKNIVMPFSENDVGATNGTLKLRNWKESILTIFQKIEYDYNNLIKNSFSRIFDNSISFFGIGAVACYRKAAIEKIGFFKKDTLAEDMDIVIELRKNGYKAINVKESIGYTIAPSDFKGLYKQRARWWAGVLQSLIKNREMLSAKHGLAYTFLFANQAFWFFYGIISFPIIIYQINYWLPYNSDSLLHIFMYFFRWFSLYGPIWVMYKLPVNGFSYYTFFGVMAGLLSTAMILISIRIFKENVPISRAVAIFFYFPYTIVLNIIIVLTLFNFKLWKKGGYFIK